ncbi:CHAP domain-containing protein [Cellulomonas sp. HZM]|uniref:CHAP domain-containing protein n=1 Tax=Cellulomonas sp. HZM TaxID=1454010 RepID=UPI0009E02FD8|nr:CHAP domain-containing protein [Cellulomonas sp. HZM]
MARRRHLTAALLAAVLALGGLVGAAGPALATGTSLKLQVSSPSIRHGEMVWFTGKLTSGGKGLKARTVVLERRTSSGWHRVATSTTSSSGTFSVRQRPYGEYSYRARATASGVKSTVRKIHLTYGKRTIAARAAILGDRAGAARGSTASAKVAGTTAVRYRSYSHGMLVQVTNKAGSVRTWFVYGDILTAYKKAGGPKGKLGVPLADPKCGLIESGCVQRFSGGAIYDNKHTKGAVAYGKTKAAEVIAAARSQVGYRQKRYNDSKYNAWVGRVGAWCSVFQSWAAVASGNPGAIPKHAKWSVFLADVRAHMKLGKTPKVGALVFYDTISDGRTAATHVGVVVKVNASSIVTIEGNTSTPGDSAGRGVYQKTRPRSMPLYYAYPTY